MSREPRMALATHVQEVRYVAGAKDGVSDAGTGSTVHQKYKRHSRRGGNPEVLIALRRPANGGYDEN